MDFSPLKPLEPRGALAAPRPAAQPAAAVARRSPKAPFATPPRPLTVLLLEGDYRLTGAVLFCLSRQPGVAVHLLTRNARSPYRFSAHVRKTHAGAPGQSPADFVAFARQAARAAGADVLLPVDVAGMRWLIAHRPALAPAVNLLPLPTTEFYEIATDKGLLAGFMQRHGIPAPITLVDLGPDLPAQLEGFPFPVLLKPIEGSGGGGITRHATPAALLRAVAALPAGSRYIVQNCLDGYDIDCNVLYHNGQLVAHSIQKGLMATGGEYAPTEAIEFVRNDAVLAVVDRLMKALRWSGVAHLDLRYDAFDHQIKVIEINTRFWLTVVGSATTAGVNFPALACLAAAGRPVVAPGFALGRYIPFVKFLKHRLRRPAAQAGLRFALRDTSVRAFLGDPLPKLCRFFAGQG